MQSENEKNNITLIFIHSLVSFEITSTHTSLFHFYPSSSAAACHHPPPPPTPATSTVTLPTRSTVFTMAKSLLIPLHRRILLPSPAARSLLFRRRFSGESSLLRVRVSRLELVLKEVLLCSRSWRDSQEKNRQGE